MEEILYPKAPRWLGSCEAAKIAGRVQHFEVKTRPHLLSAQQSEMQALRCKLRVQYSHIYIYIHPYYTQIIRRFRDMTWHDITLHCITITNTSAITIKVHRATLHCIALRYIHVLYCMIVLYVLFQHVPNVFPKVTINPGPFPMKSYLHHCWRSKT